MRVATMATGGVGGYLGAKLIEAGHEVAMVARGRHLEVIRSEGLTVETNKGTFTAKPALATADPAEIGPVDVVLFAVKLPDTQGAAEAARPLVGPDTVVVPFQNGVEACDTLARVLGEEHAANGCGYIAISIAEPGRLRKVGDLERFLFGEAGGGQSPRLQALRDGLVAAGVNAPVPDDIRVEVWRKFAFLASFSGMTAASRSPIGVMQQDPAMWDILIRAVSEVVAVAKARGIAVPDDLAARHDAFMRGLPGEMTASQAHDLAAGNRLEVENLSGAVARLGRAAGVDTPVHATLHATLRPFAAGGRPSS